MIDIHSHILPGLDDGAATIEEAIAMASCAIADGIKQMVVTPHVKSRTYPSKKAILDKMVNLQDVLQKRQTEVDFINGAAVREAKKLGMAIPVTETLFRLVKTIQANYDNIL